MGLPPRMPTPQHLSPVDVLDYQALAHNEDAARGALPTLRKAFGRRLSGADLPGNRLHQSRSDADTSYEHVLAESDLNNWGELIQGPEANLASRDWQASAQGSQLRTLTVAHDPLEGGPKRKYLYEGRRTGDEVRSRAQEPDDWVLSRVTESSPSGDKLWHCSTVDGGREYRFYLPGARGYQQLKFDGNNTWELETVDEKDGFKGSPLGDIQSIQQNWENPTLLSVQISYKDGRQEAMSLWFDEQDCLQRITVLNPDENQNHDLTWDTID